MSCPPRCCSDAANRDNSTNQVFLDMFLFGSAMASTTALSVPSSTPLSAGNSTYFSQPSSSLASSTTSHFTEFPIDAAASLATGAVIGIVLGAIIALTLVTLCIVWLIKHKRSSNNNALVEEEMKSAVYEPIDVLNVLTDENESTTNTDRWLIDSNELQLDKEIGRGAFGVVYKAHWHGSVVAVKCLTNNNNNDDNEALLREASAMAALRPHPNVVQLFGVSRLSDGWALVSHYCAKGALSDLLQGKRVEWTSQRKLLVAYGAAAGLTHLHQQSIIHRDVAARNVLLDKDLTPKLSDFGLARIDSGEENVTQTTVGPVRWMAPEQLRSLQYSTKTDVYAFGVLLFEIFSQSVPWSGANNMIVVQRVLNGDRLDDKVAPTKELRRLLRQCWSNDSAKRPTMNDVLDTLQSAAGLNRDEKPYGDVPSTGAIANLSDNDYVSFGGNVNSHYEDVFPDRNDDDRKHYIDIDKVAQ